MLTPLFANANGVLYRSPRQRPGFWRMSISKPCSRSTRRLRSTCLETLVPRAGFRDFSLAGTGHLAGSHFWWGIREMVLSSTALKRNGRIHEFEMMPNPRATLICRSIPGPKAFFEEFAIHRVVGQATKAVTPVIRPGSLALPNDVYSLHVTESSSAHIAGVTTRRFPPA